jgi:hypothetical protein
MGSEEEALAGGSDVGWLPLQDPGSKWTGATPVGGVPVARQAGARNRACTFGARTCHSSAPLRDRSLLLKAPGPALRQPKVFEPKRGRARFLPSHQMILLPLSGWGNSV